MDLLKISPIRLMSTESCESSTYGGKEDTSSLDISLYENSNSCTPIISKKFFNQNLDNVQKFEDIESQTPEMETKRIYINRINSPKTRRKRLGSSVTLFGNWSSNRTKFHKQKLAVYNFLQRPRGLLAIGYHVIISCVVLICLVFNILSTIEGNKDMFNLIPIDF